MPMSDAALERMEARAQRGQSFSASDKRALLAEVREHRPLPNRGRVLLQELRRAVAGLQGALGRGGDDAQVDAAAARAQEALDDYAP